ncbi:Smr/MutS family protein [Chachezhania sediminis]|uniref:Smr/MutS family protein n=1 Tax=Chachezhania sediminis TaxID=2599291 RepID=UPI00131D8C7E|nr:Smr/MutS family protein [Chachezhania sediminis]
MSRKRRPTEEELELWGRIARSADPIGRRKLDSGAELKPDPKPDGRINGTHTAVPERPGLASLRIGKTSDRPAPGHDLVPPLAERLRNQPLHMDRKAFTRLRRGKLEPEARIDLHGMTQARAHPALTRFILSSQGQGRRLVLVITGKGRPGAATGPIPEPHGILRHHVPRWLAMPPLNHAVLQITAAHVRHGGEGALYVYLRKPR